MTSTALTPSGSASPGEPALPRTGPRTDGGANRVLGFDDTDAPADVLDALLLEPFIDGSQPWSRTKRLDSVRAGATLLPAGVAPARFASDQRGDCAFATGEGWTLRSLRWRSGGGEVTVVAESEELAISILTLATEAAEDDPAPEDERVEIGFWHLSSHGPRRWVRPIAASLWSEIRVNYPAAAAAAIDKLVGLTAAQLPGRVILVHGPPGTGKTTSLRTLARHWRSWCTVDFVIDPDRLFRDASYLIDVIVGQANDDESIWRLLLLEDCDELIRADAKQSTGQALSRLLNLTDGLLGQGRRVLVAITTNEDIARLHPAVTRPGRCLAQIEVGPLSYAEAVRWLGYPDGVPADGATLAQLVALRSGQAPMATSAPAAVAGLYL